MSVFIDNGEPGTWAAVMPFLRNVRFLPDVPLKGSLNAGEGSADAAPLAPVPFHHGSELARD